MEVYSLYSPAEEKCKPYDTCILLQFKYNCSVYYRECMISVTKLNIFFFLPIYLSFLNMFLTSIFSEAVSTRYRALMKDY